MNRLILAVAVVLAGCSNAPVDQQQCPLEVLCAEGTALVGSECRGTNHTTCGDGTLLSNELCFPGPSACGNGTVLKGRRCELPLPDPNVGAFVTRTSYQESGDGKVYGSGGGLSHHVRHVWTELPAADARAWGSGESPMIGTGLALHLALDDISSSDTIGAPNNTITFSVQLTNLTQGDGSCLADVKPHTANDRHQLALYQWSAGDATPVACAKAGSVTVTYNRYSYTLEVNAVLGDGTTVRKTFYQAVTN